MRWNVVACAGGEALRTEGGEESANVTVALAGEKSLLFNGLLDEWDVHRGKGGERVVR